MTVVTRSSSIFRRHHQKISPLVMSAADANSLQHIAKLRNITACNIFCNNNSYSLTSFSNGYRFSSYTKRHISHDTDPKASSSVNNNSNNNFTERKNNDFIAFGGSNFQQMLQYQNMENQPSRPQRKKTSIQYVTGVTNDQEAKQEHLTAVHKQRQKIRHRQHSKNDTHNRMRPRQAVRRLDNRREGINEKTDYASTLDSNNRKIENASSRKVASSDWILVSNTPPMSKLADILSGIEKIVAFEMDKGVIDLEKIEDYVSSGVNAKHRRGNLDKVGARKSFYATEQIDLSSGIPLWAPDLEDGELPSHMVLEARLHLSQHARPKGWFLRLPSRSVVHAILNHSREAEEAFNLEREQMKLEESAVKSERRKWREGLWKGVWGEHENNLVSNKNKKTLDKETEEEWKLAFGVDSDERLNIHDDNAISVDDETASGADEAAIVYDEILEESMSSEEDPHAMAFAYLDEYAQSKPFPEQFKSVHHPTLSGYHRLTCGSTELKIEEFHPEHHAKNMRSWDQASFQISPLLNLSDSVVRIETEALGKSVDDIQYLFRGYDLESILSSKVSSPSLHPSCAKYITLHGWNVNGGGNNVDILVDGRAKSLSTDAARPRHTFLVRFATASSARMAVRDELRFRQGDDMLTMTQFPKSWL